MIYWIILSLLMLLRIQLRKLLIDWLRYYKQDYQLVLYAVTLVRIIGWRLLCEIGIILSVFIIIDGLTSLVGKLPQNRLMKLVLSRQRNVPRVRDH